MKLVSIVSARPNFVKLAAVHHAMQEHAPDWQHIIVHTGQHYDSLLSDVFFTQLAIPKPQWNLGVEGGGNNTDTVSRTVRAVVPVLEQLKPNLVLVYGDVSGALGGARAARELFLPVAHIEAGLRSFDDTMPEEYNRSEIDKISAPLFVTEQSGVENLKREGITEGVHFVGNTMVDTLMRMKPSILKAPLPIEARQLARRSDPFVVSTLHRPSNVDEETSLRRCMTFLQDIAHIVPVFLPLHPRLKKSVEHLGYLSQPLHNIYLGPPMAYLPFLHLVQRAVFVLTDSGGIQEETTFLEKKCFTFRKNTERPCTLEENGGSNTLIDLENAEDRAKVLAYAAHPVAPRVTIPEKWDGKAGERIIEVLRTFHAQQ